MKLDNPFQMNDWKLKKFLLVILSLQLAVWGCIGLELLGISTLILRPIVSFFYLIFVPGILILRLIKLHDLGNIETLVYTIGLSITTLMFTGFFMNTFYPLFGIPDPISLRYLILTMSFFILALSFLCYMTDDKVYHASLLDLKYFFSTKVLYLCAIPLLAILGTYLMNYYQCNILLIILIVLIALTVYFTVAYNLIPNTLYPLVLFSISVSLLFHKSLISSYLTGWDIHIEYYMSNLVVADSYWNSQLPSNVNAMLSIVMFAPIYSKISGMDLIWIFKIIYPLIFSLVPVGLYRIFQKGINDQLAFLSSTFFISYFGFFVEMNQLARQQIAEFYFMLLILLFFDEGLNKVGRSILLIIFTFSIVVSHYGLSYIYLASLVLVILTCTSYSRLIIKNHYRTVISSNIVLLTIVFTLVWYMYISNSSSFNIFVQISNHILNSVNTELFNTNSVEGLQIIAKQEKSQLYLIYKYLHIICQSFISLGLFFLIFNLKNFKFEKEYVFFCIVYYLILLCCLTLPYFASALNTSRLYQISLIILSPLCVIGGLFSLNLFCNILGQYGVRISKDNIVKYFSIFLVIYLFFNTGLIFELFKDQPYSISLNRSLEYPCFTEQEVVGAKWISEVKNNNIVYANHYRNLLLRGFNPDEKYGIFSSNLNIQKGSYIYLGKYMLNEIVTLKSSSNSYICHDNIISGENKIYDNMGSQIYII